MQQSGMGITSGENEAFHWEIVALIREHWVSNLAHSLSNPLFAARGYIRMLLQSCNSGLSETEMRYLGLALENIEKLVFQVRGMEVFPEIRDLEFTCFSMQSLLQEVVEEMRRSPANVEVRECLSVESATTIGDRAKLRKALECFVASTARFAAPDGALSISARHAGDRISVQLTAGPDCSDLQPDLGIASRLWQLHGGRVCTDRSGNAFSLVCELPLIHLPRQTVLVPKKGLVQ
jgi:signal transduction histidine kinase